MYFLSEQLAMGTVLCVCVCCDQRLLKQSSAEEKSAAKNNRELVIN